MAEETQDKLMRSGSTRETADVEKHIQEKSAEPQIPRLRSESFRPSHAKSSRFAF
ncbi:MAG: hypothetical protein QOJ51_5600 [Acidobacteriaceae bacterium]|nr:hypothetical protein [Acidobacteriaceae bacterium]